ncbi:MAG: hypothetical protein N3A54_05790, partial [Patescibacteria group bacterium]|nr:hypothetical protein [Patescibacteria group bacterium]
MAPLDTSDSSIDYHIRTYRNILKQAHEVRISQLIDSHIQMRSVLHEKGDQNEVDTSAFIYSILRLPDCISHVHTILLGQSSTVFKKNGFADVESWQEVSAPGRRRKMFYDGNGTLAVYISSVSDVDDMICLLTAYQIEWNKFHKLLNSSQTNDVIPQEDKDRLTIIVKNNYELFLNAIQSRMLDYRVCLLSGSYIEYFRSTQMWWNHIKTIASHLHIEDRPVYFISSNTHAIANILTRTSITCEKEILEFVRYGQDKSLSEKYADVFASDSLHDKEFFLYYVAKKYERANPEYRKRKQIDEDKIGFMTIYPTHYIDVPAQIVELKNLAGKVFHEQFPFDTRPLAKSDAIIINIDYPLGWSAYQIFSEISQNVEYLAGVYIMGKAAILHGNIGDIVLP